MALSAVINPTAPLVHNFTTVEDEPDVAGLIITEEKSDLAVQVHTFVCVVGTSVLETSASIVDVSTVTSILEASPAVVEVLIKGVVALAEVDLDLVVNIPVDLKTAPVVVSPVTVNSVAFSSYAVVVVSSMVDMPLVRKVFDKAGNVVEVALVSVANMPKVIPSLKPDV